MPRERSSHLLYKAADGEHLSERHRVNPDDTRRGPGCAIVKQTPGNASHTFEESAAIFSVAQHLVEPVRQAQQYDERQHQTVEKIAQAEPF